MCLFICRYIVFHIAVFITELHNEQTYIYICIHIHTRAYSTYNIVLYMVYSILFSLQATARHSKTVEGWLETIFLPRKPKPARRGYTVPSYIALFILCLVYYMSSIVMQALLFEDKLLLSLHLRTDSSWCSLRNESFLRGHTTSFAKRSRKRRTRRAR